MTGLQLPACAVGDWTSYVFPLVPLKRQAPEEDTPVRWEVASLPPPRGFPLILGRGVSLQPEGAADGGGGVLGALCGLMTQTQTETRAGMCPTPSICHSTPILSHNPGIESPPPPPPPRMQPP